MQGEFAFPVLQAHAGPVTVKRQFRELNVTPLRANYDETLPIVAKGLIAEQKRGLYGA